MARHIWHIVVACFLFSCLFAGFLSITFMLWVMNYDGHSGEPAFLPQCVTCPPPPRNQDYETTPVTVYTGEEEDDFTHEVEIDVLEGDQIGDFD